MFASIHLVVKIVLSKMLRISSVVRVLAPELGAVAKLKAVTGLVDNCSDATCKRHVSMRRMIRIK